MKAQTLLKANTIFSIPNQGHNTFQFEKLCLTQSGHFFANFNDSLKDLIGRNESGEMKVQMQAITVSLLDHLRFISLADAVISHEFCYSSRLSCLEMTDSV